MAKGCTQAEGGNVMHHTALGMLTPALTVKNSVSTTPGEMELTLRGNILPRACAAGGEVRT
eukprot:1147695-Pelagomonas_calceolata.AAC.4